MSHKSAQVMEDLYASLSVESRIVVQQRTGEIKTLMRRTAQDIVDIGHKLIEVKERLGHGLFGAWLQAEFEWTQKTAERFINVAQRFQNRQFVDFDMASSALYLLAAPSAPESAREEAVQRAEEGERITHRVAHELIAAHKAMPISHCQELPSRLHSREDEESRLFSKEDSVVLAQRREPVKLGWNTSHELVPSAERADSKPVGVAHNMEVHFSSRTVEHCTPENIIVPTLDCLGEIDLDPCSEGGDPSNVPARAHYTVSDDGLAHPWHGRIYMNPPYGREIGDWVEKLCSEYEAGQVIEAIALLPSRTDTRWWARLRNHPVCFVQGRLTFVGSRDPAPFPSAVFYLGGDVAKFCHSFGGVGDIYRRIATEE